MSKVLLYDTTLRDGAQAGGVSFSAADKLRIAEKLDSLGLHYIEGGWPGSNPKDMAFFSDVKKLKLANAKIARFSTVTLMIFLPVHGLAQVTHSVPQFSTLSRTQQRIGTAPSEITGDPQRLERARPALGAQCILRDE